MFLTLMKTNNTQVGLICFSKFILIIKSMGGCIRYSCRNAAESETPLPQSHPRTNRAKSAILSKLRFASRVLKFAKILTQVDLKGCLNNGPISLTCLLISTVTRQSQLAICHKNFDHNSNFPKR